MPHEDKLLKADVTVWLRKAADDLRCAEIDLAAEPPAVDDALFHCQQAVEKSLKAFLTWHDRPFRKIHDISEIGRECATIDPSLDDPCRGASGLTYYASAFRYPGDVEEIPRAEADEALALARSVHAEVLSRLPEVVKS